MGNQITPLMCPMRYWMQNVSLIPPEVPGRAVGVSPKLHSPIADITHQKWLWRQSFFVPTRLRKKANQAKRRDERRDCDDDGVL
jgi:hypothetical protein